jgi:xeroderma pigmentosum group C-complementing protein
MKMVKHRAVTITRKREMEVALEKARATGQGGEDEEELQGLYARSQTELYTPKPVVDVCFGIDDRIADRRLILVLTGKSPQERFWEY